jgi:transcriptional regulator with XRE-family HTH domain
MRLTDTPTDAAALVELGLRIARHRLERNWTQAELAREAGVGQATVQRVESGRSVQMTSMVRLMRTLGLLEAFDAAIPESVRLPIAELERDRRRTRRRARARRESPDEGRRQQWTWGDESHGGP